MFTAFSQGNGGGDGGGTTTKNRIIFDGSFSFAHSVCVRAGCAGVTTACMCDVLVTI